MPFFWRPLEDPAKNPFPTTLPFELILNRETGLLGQRPNDDVIEVLRDSYKKGTHLEGRMDAEGIGAEYAADFLAFIESTLGPKETRAKSILEIGCGTGYLLSRLRGASPVEVSEDEMLARFQEASGG